MPVLDIDYNLMQTNVNHLMADNNLVNELKAGDECLKYANKDLVKQLISGSNEKSDKTMDSLDVIEGNSDLIVNQYEGGFKLWEGLHDIIDYFHRFKTFNQFSNHQNLNVLELGCGSGLVSIYLSKKLTNANIYLQDFNEDVIKFFTSINVFMNDISNTKSFSRFHYLFGDWSAIAEDIESSGVKFDLIFMTETLYNVENYPKLLNVFKSGLSSFGTVYIGSKSHYFGIGGGSHSFMDFIQTDGHFECDICHEIDSPLIRHIIKLWPKS